jgi:hypothetical protein
VTTIQSRGLQRPRELGEVLRDAWALYRADWRGFVAIGAGTIPFALASSAVQLAIKDEVTAQLVLVPVLLASVPPLAVVEGAVLAYLLSVAGNRPATEGQAFLTALRRLPSLAGSAFITVAVCAALFVTVVLIPLGVVLIVRWVFAVPAVMFEGDSAVASLRRSAALVSGRWWVTFGRVAAIGLLVLAVNLVLLNLVARAPAAVFALVTAIGEAFTMPFFAIALALMYFDLKARKAMVAPPSGEQSQT